MDTTALWVTIVLIFVGLLLLSLIIRSARRSRRRTSTFRHRPFMENRIETTEGFQQSDPHTASHHKHHHHHHSPSGSSISGSHKHHNHHSHSPSGGSISSGHHHSSGGSIGGGHHSGGSWGGGTSGGHGGHGGHH